jgi:hypothetical protein
MSVSTFKTAVILCVSDNFAFQEKFGEYAKNLCRSINPNIAVIVGTPTPTAPTTLVALVRKRLFLRSIVCSDIRLLLLFEKMMKIKTQ